MVLNVIWLVFFFGAFIACMVQWIGFGNTEIFNKAIMGAFDMSKTAFEIALGLTGILSLWLGILKIGEKAGAVQILAKIVQPPGSERKRSATFRPRRLRAGSSGEAARQMSRVFVVARQRQETRVHEKNVANVEMLPMPMLPVPNGRALRATTNHGACRAAAPLEWRVAVLT